MFDTFDENYAYKQGREDAINQVINGLRAEFAKQNNHNSKFIPSIVLNEGIFEALEELKEESNGD